MPRIRAATVAEHRERTYAALLDAVDALVLERGLDAVSLQEVAARAGVARTAVYNYAPDRTALLIAAGQRAAEQMRTEVAAVAADQGADAAVRLDRLVGLLLVRFGASTHHLLLVRALHTSLRGVERERVLAPFREDVGRHVVRVIRDGTTSGAFDPGLDIELVAELVAGVVDAAVARAVAEPDAAPAVARSTSTFLRGALAPGPHGGPDIAAARR